MRGLLEDGRLRYVAATRAPPLHLIGATGYRQNDDGVTVPMTPILLTARTPVARGQRFLAVHHPSCRRLRRPDPRWQSAAVRRCGDW